MDYENAKVKLTPDSLIGDTILAEVNKYGTKLKITEGDFKGQDIIIWSKEGTAYDFVKGKDIITVD